MNWRLFFAIFGSVFLAELGDKTQLAILSFSNAAEKTSPWMVFAAGSLALVLSSAIAVFAGETISRFVSPLLLKRISGALLIVVGALLVFAKAD